MAEPSKSPDRKYKRKKILAIVDLYKSISDAPTGQGCLVNISIGGASIESNVVFQKGQYIILNIPISSENRYSIAGEVLRVQEMPLQTFNYGIKFKKLSLREKFRLFRIIRILLKNKVPHPSAKQE